MNPNDTSGSITTGYIYTMPQQGWQCPVCRRCYAPTTMMCLYCPEPPVWDNTTTTTCPDGKLGHTVTITQRPVEQADAWFDRHDFYDADDLFGFGDDYDY